MKRLPLALLLLLIAFLPAHGQDFRYPEGNRIDIDNPSRYLNEGPVVFNGQDYASFFSMQGPEDADYNLYFRRLDRDGLPLGAPVRVSDAEGRDLGIAAVWDGEAYIVFHGFDEDKDGVLIRVSRIGAVLATTVIPGEHFFWNIGIKGSPGWAHHHLDVVDGMVNLFFTSGSSVSAGKSWLARVRTDLIGAVTLKALPATGLQPAALMGVAEGPDGYLVLLGELGASDQAVKKTRLLMVGYDGSVPGVSQAGPQELDNCFSLIGPVFNGTGYFVCYTQYETGQRNNRSLVLGRDLAVLHGPNELGENASPYLHLSASWMGYGVHVLVMSSPISAEGTLIFNDKGKFFASPLWHKDDLYSSTIRPFQAFGGLGTTLIYSFYESSYKGHHLLANQVTLPTALTKPAIYQLEAAAQELKPGKRMIFWASAGGGSVTLKGKGFTYRNLPPIGHLAAPVKGGKQKIRLTVSGPGGTSKKKIVIN